MFPYEFVYVLYLFSICEIELQNMMCLILGLDIFYFTNTMIWDKVQDG
jgi:hypothetical protein